MHPISLPLPMAKRDAVSATDASLAKPMDEAAFCAFYQETAPRLWAYIRRASGDAALADDIFQESFCRFLQARLPELEPQQRKAYLYRIATSLLADHWRRSQRERRWSLRMLFEEQNPSRAREQAVNFDNKGLGNDMTRLFARLKPQEQSLLWLAYVEGFDHREIAAALQLRERSIRVLLFRARKKLAGILEQHGLGPQEEV
ncbi:MAG: RNA polymerase sigma factor [Acidobacteria bacterium]|nr:RNA polymerase sigma factor [Acidobacteriota bacterium]